MPAHLDLDSLRTFVTAQDLGGYNRAAEVLHRSQSAVSQQLRKLEEQTGQVLAVREGRRLVLTSAGELLLAYARRMLSLNDEAVTALRGQALAGSVRFGVVGDFAESWLPEVLAIFRRAHPKVALEVTVDRAVVLFEALDHGSLDLVMAFGGDHRPDRVQLFKAPQRWLGPPGYHFEAQVPVELVLLPAPCRFRQRAMDRLEASGISWRISFAGRSVATLWAAVRAGLGCTFRMVTDLPSGIVILDEPDGGIGDADISINLHDGGRGHAESIGQLKELIIELSRLKNNDL